MSFESLVLKNHVFQRTVQLKTIFIWNEKEITNIIPFRKDSLQLGILLSIVLRFPVVVDSCCHRNPRVYSEANTLVMKDTNPDMYPNTRCALGPGSMCPAATQAPQPKGSMRDCLGDNQHHLSAGDPNKNGQGKNLIAEMEIRFQRTPVSSSGTPENDVQIQHGDSFNTFMFWQLNVKQTT